MHYIFPRLASIRKALVLAAKEKRTMLLLKTRILNALVCFKNPSISRFRDSGANGQGRRFRRSRTYEREKREKMTWYTSAAVLVIADREKRKREWKNEVRAEERERKGENDRGRGRCGGPYSYGSHYREWSKHCKSIPWHGCRRFVRAPCSNMPIHTSGRTLHRCRTPKYKILGGDTKEGEGGEGGGGLDELERAVYIALYLFPLM